MKYIFKEQSDCTHCFSVHKTLIFLERVLNHGYHEFYKDGVTSVCSFDPAKLSLELIASFDQAWLHQGVRLKQKIYCSSDWSSLSEVSLI